MAAQAQPAFKPAVRLGLSLIVVVHLIAVFAPPLAFQAQGPEGASATAQTLLSPVRGYSEFLYMDRGYAFFAPDPGPSHLIQAAVTSKTGEKVEHTFPDRQVQWPRLLYHRHFMISEFVHEIYEPQGPPAELVEVDPIAAEYWQRSRSRYEDVRQSIVEHLRQANPGHKVAVRRVEHLVPSWNDYRVEPIELTDPRLYRVLLDEPIEGPMLEGFNGPLNNGPLNNGPRNDLEFGPIPLDGLPELDRPSVDEQTTMPDDGLLRLFGDEEDAS